MWDGRVEVVGGGPIQEHLVSMQAGRAAAVGLEGQREGPNEDTGPGAPELECSFIKSTVAGLWSAPWTLFRPWPSGRARSGPGEPGNGRSLSQHYSTKNFLFQKCVF